MQRISQVQAIFKSFPWGRLEKDDTFCLELARGRFDVLGDTNTGFWSQRGGHASHQFEGEGQHDMADAGVSTKFQHQLAKQFSHLYLLHRKTHLTDEGGWKLESGLIPYRDMAKVSADRQFWQRSSRAVSVTGTLGICGANCRSDCPPHHSCTSH